MPGDKENKEEVSTEDVVKNVSYDDVKKKIKKNEIQVTFNLDTLQSFSFWSK
jgi:hypothetical protein